MAKMEIEQFTVKTKLGNFVQFFFNPENNLVVVDIIHKNEKGGNEIFRQRINEAETDGLQHCV
jgi:hypothetical protein